MPGSSEGVFGVNGRCGHLDCTKRPTYGLVGTDGERRAQFCAPHAKPGMVNVSKRRCAVAGCPRHPSFARKGDKTSCFCAEHATEGMVSPEHTKQSATDKCTGVFPFFFFPFFLFFFFGGRVATGPVLPDSRVQRGPWRPVFLLVVVVIPTTERNMHLVPAQDFEQAVENYGCSPCCCRRC